LGQVGGNTHLESHLDAFLTRRVRLLGGVTFKLAPIVSGTPDRLVLLPGGGSYFVELKQQGGKPSPVQRVMHDRLNRLGSPVWVLDSREGVLEFLRERVDTLGPYSGDTARR
jgi:hypothetical protein